MSSHNRRDEFLVPRVRIDPETFADILLAIELCPVEVSGLARAERVGDLFTIFGDVAIFKQECSLHGTEFDPHAYGAWKNQMMREERHDEKDAFANCWWHSHVLWPSYWSETDRRNITGWPGESQEWLISIVGNKLGSFQVRLDLFFGAGQETFEISGSDFSFTVPTSKEDLRRLMVSREGAMWRQIEEKVTVLEAPPETRFESILRRLFSDA